MFVTLLQLPQSATVCHSSAAVCHSLPQPATVCHTLLVFCSRQLAIIFLRLISPILIHITHTITHLSLSPILKVTEADISSRERRYEGSYSGCRCYWGDQETCSLLFTGSVTEKETERKWSTIKR